MKQELVRAQPRALDVQPQRSPSLLALQRVCEEGAEVRCDGYDVGGRLRRTRLSVKIVTPPDYCAVGFECETVPKAACDSHDVAQSARNISLSKAVVPPCDDPSIAP